MNAAHTFKRISALVLGALLAATLHIAAQQPPQTTVAVAAPLPVYDVVSIHENKSGSNGTSFDTENATWVATNVSLVSLLTNAYNIRSNLMSGLPKWASAVRFDVNAKISDPDIEEPL